MSPSGNGLGADRPLGFAMQIDDDEVQSNYFFPAAAPGLEPPQWDTPDGFVANSIISAKNNFTLAPGAHTLKVGLMSSTYYGGNSQRPAVIHDRARGRRAEDCDQYAVSAY